ncbi:serine threonine protein kinase [Ophiostoma piceae UAMH 11346]|uniref:Serine threonine protein kinase n=1 Tax=Ophiostoma piceae (strain UAMH 11346) TaxID=1262450 RepID=S3BU00_OPHP1|nr:serine threonine protein kinase [Ophiostoma piceae UAMH 11346]
MEYKGDDAASEPEHTVFYLVGSTPAAHEIVALSKNEHLRVDTRAYGTALAVTLNSAKLPPFLAHMGSHPDDDIYLKAKQILRRCYFCFNKISGELLLRDASYRHGTKLFRIVEEKKYELKTNLGQCAVVLSRNPNTTDDQCYELRFSDTVIFTIYPPFNEKEVPLAAKLGFCVSDNIDMQWPGRDGWGITEIGYTDKEYLGGGGQGCVKVVVTHATGSHVAVKACSFTGDTRGTPNEIKKLTITQLQLVRTARDQSEHESYIVPWYHYQFSSDVSMDIFMPIYWCSLADLIDNGLFRGSQAQYMAARMVHNISTALCCLAASPDPIVHRDVKPENILYRDGLFYLADFGIAKAVNKNYTKIGTECFQSPEANQEQEVAQTSSFPTKKQAGPFEKRKKPPMKQLPAMDMFSLGLTLAACLVRRRLRDTYDRWRGQDTWVNEASNVLQDPCACFGPSIVSMLAPNPGDRPSAATVLAEVELFLVQHGSTIGVYEMPDEDFAKASAIAGRNNNLQPTAQPPQLAPAPNVDTMYGPTTLPTPAATPLQGIYKSSG